jgi:hypothetical protein
MICESQQWCLKNLGRYLAVILWCEWPAEERTVIQ